MSVTAPCTAPDHDECPLHGAGPEACCQCCTQPLPPDVQCAVMIGRPGDTELIYPPATAQAMVWAKITVEEHKAAGHTVALITTTGVGHTPDHDPRDDARRPNLRRRHRRASR